MNFKVDGNDMVDVSLRKIDYTDTENIIEWRNSEEVKKYFIVQDELTRETHEQWLETRVKSGSVEQFIIVDNTTGMDVGSVYLRDVDYNNKKAEFGIFIGEEIARGKGIGSLATKKMIEYAFGKLQLHKVYLRVRSTNDVAISCYKKVGFDIEGTFRDDVLIDGKYHDITWMSIINKK